MVLALFTSGKLDHTTKAMYTELSLAAYLFSLEASFEPKLVNACSPALSATVCPKFRYYRLSGSESRAWLRFNYNYVQRTVLACLRLMADLDPNCLLCSDPYLLHSLPEWARRRVNKFILWT